MSSILTSAPPSPSLVSFGSSRAPSPLHSSELEQPAVQANIDPEAKATRHARYYFKDGNVVFLIEEVRYNVHRYFFERDSAHFRSILENAQGADVQNPVVLPGVSCGDFDEFLAILYPTDFRHPAEKTTAQWTSILHLAAKWGFASIQLLAIDSLAATALPVDKIVLGRRYGIAGWLRGAYEAVCTRAGPLTAEEGLKLGVEDVVRIAAARQVYGCAQARYDTKHLSGDLGGIFGLAEDGAGASGGSEDIDNAIKILEGQVVVVQAEFAALPTPGQNPCRYGYSDPLNTCINQNHDFDETCAHCRARKESDERRLKREEKEDKERRLEDLKEKRQHLGEKQERMALFG